MNIIDFTGVATIKELHERIGDVMSLPEYYGENLDALQDVLSEVNGQVIFEGTEAVDDDMTEYVSRLKSMCMDAQEGNPLLQIIFL